MAPQLQHANLSQPDRVDASPSSSRCLAGAALSYLDRVPSSPTPTPQSGGVKTATANMLHEAKGDTRIRPQPTPIDTLPSKTGPGESTVTQIGEAQGGHADIDRDPLTNLVVSVNSVQAPPRPAGAVETHPLPSLLRYVDHHLWGDTLLHNSPPDQSTVCNVCKAAYSNAQAETIFLPLTPCGCWVHYTCFIWWTAQFLPVHNGCPGCNTKLFQWEGITVLTIGTRTGLTMQDALLRNDQIYTEPLTNRLITSHQMDYEAECALIDSFVDRHYHAHLAHPSKHADGSPDLVQCYYDVLDNIDKVGKPRAKWLQWTTATGFYLFAMLVAIKMGRFLVDEHGKIQGTIAWKQFEEARGMLQEKILEETNREIASAPTGKCYARYGGGVIQVWAREK